MERSNNKLIMRTKYLTKWLLFMISALSLNGQNDNDKFRKAFDNINQTVLKAQLGILASDWTEGRQAGEKGELIASDYIASMLQLYGVKPGGDYPGIRGFSGISENREKTWFQNFVLLKTSPGDEQLLKIRTSEGNTSESISFKHNIDFTIRSVSNDIEIEAPVAFVGYGFKNEKLKYDDFGKRDLKGKLILKISGAPGFAKEVLSPSEIAATVREGENIARKMGAAGIIEFNPGSTVTGAQPGTQMNDLSPSETNPLYNREWADYTLPDKMSPDIFLKITTTAKIANEILKGTGLVLDDYIRKLESGSSEPIPEIKGKSIYLKTTVRTETVRARNVIGVIEGKEPDKIIVLGAHYDHLGSENGYIWNGADDNGSGAAGVMTLAKAIMETGIKPSKSIIIALWSAEEMGLLGSRFYVENLPYPWENLSLNVNFDMISRYLSDNDKKKVNMIYTESYPIFRTITEENLKKAGIDLEVDYQPSKDPPGGSDHRTFVEAGIPVMRFKPGHREQYHTPADDIDTVNWEIMEKIVRISFANIWYLANNEW